LPLFSLSCGSLFEQMPMFFFPSFFLFPTKSPRSVREVVSFLPFSPFSLVSRPRGMERSRAWAFSFPSSFFFYAQGCKPPKGSVNHFFFFFFLLFWVVSLKVNELGLQPFFFFFFFLPFLPFSRIFQIGNIPCFPPPFPLFLLLML